MGESGREWETVEDSGREWGIVGVESEEGEGAAHGYVEGEVQVARGVGGGGARVLGGGGHGCEIGRGDLEGWGG